jgi:hypothetical protein
MHWNRDKVGRRSFSLIASVKCENVMGVLHRGGVGVNEVVERHSRASLKLLTNWGRRRRYRPLIEDVRSRTWRPAPRVTSLRVREDDNSTRVIINHE